MASASTGAQCANRVGASVNYVARTSGRLRYHANDSSRDTIKLETTQVEIEDARSLADPPRLDREGFTLVSHVSAVRDFTDPAEVARIHAEEIRRLLRDVSGADEVVVTAPGVLRYGERSRLSGQLDNSRPARFVHVDISDRTAETFATQSNPRAGQQPRRAVSYNVWRAFSPPPQDTPLALCDARSVEASDLIEADAIFDSADRPEWSFEGWVVAANPRHRWVYGSEMTRDEVWVFVTNDRTPGLPHNVPHSAFDDPGVSVDCAPRASIEMRGIAYWF